ncbi:bromodomain protein (macronuclear) [Tetrahymena thermophila SB210]|uniref:Bromodomain protein n=1 Tax=Tetrahymena thermophila (strain SB210) TaxID=312017 RepID=I7LZW3_TETTS|nr:bromodomain protein [Tetrahymena thermophila SB210]EAR85029.1 bromodomain protein [Tetrahymena thermophila SB210]|eukprot:XP_001032692.1 bromodomain protein [Tetrahymena thermophila SB210]
MDKQVQSECSKVLKQLLKLPESYPFREPVDYEQLQLFDYPDIIKNPMDLGTIEQNLKAKKYKQPKDFFDDIFLVWNNCKMYNQDGSNIYQQALNMEKATNAAKYAFEQSLKKLNQTQAQATQNQSSSAGIAGKQKKTEKSVSSSIIKKKIHKNKEGSSSITVNTNTNVNVASGNNNNGNNNNTQYQQQQNVQSVQYSKKERQPPVNKNEQQQEKYANQQERKYAHISLRLNLAFKLKNATEDKLVNLFAMLAEKHPETLSNIENREQKLSMNLTQLPDQTIQNMIAALEFKD